MLKSEKPGKVDELAGIIGKYSTVGLVDIHKMPARTFQVIRKNLSNTAEIKVSKKTVIQRGIEKSGKLKGLEKYVEGEQGLLISNENPFRLFRILKENVVSASAKIGDTAPTDIIISKGVTSVPPGPAISTFQKAGLKTTVQQGKIAVAEDKVVVKAGEKVTEDMVNVMNLLKMEPMKISLNLVAAWENSVIYTREILNIDPAEYARSVEKAVHEMINLSVNTGYPTKESVQLMITKAFSEARALCIEAKITEKEFIDDVLRKASIEMKSLEALLEKK